MRLRPFASFTLLTPPFFPSTRCLAGNNRVRAVSVATGYTVTLAGGTATWGANNGINAGWVDGVSSAARFNNPRGIAIDANGVIYVAGAQILGRSGTCVTVAGSDAHSMRKHEGGVTALLFS